MVVPACHSHARGAAHGEHFGSAVPTTWPAALMALAWLYWIPSTVPMSVTVPRSQLTPWLAKLDGTAEAPTTCPLTLTAVAIAPPVAPGSDGSIVTVPFCHTKAGPPTICPRALMPVAAPRLSGGLPRRVWLPAWS
jgi:hypothetical protein